MKKSIAAAIAAAVVVGASSTTFAAANPFVDVPAGHWAYKAVYEVAEAGLIEGYGDGTFRGERAITRYEMAQIVARALANYQNYQASGNTAVTSRGNVKGTLDMLASEFRDELDSLGVRVAELEKYADKVVWTGELRYRYWNDKEDLRGSGSEKHKSNQLQMRLFPTAEVNDHWKLKARMTATSDMKNDTTGEFKLTYAFAEGKYDNLTLMVGKMPFYTNVDEGMLIDDFFSGAAAVWGDKFKVALMAGRWSATDDSASYQGGEVSYEGDKYYIGAGYHHFNSDSFRGLDGYKNSDDANVWAVGGKYKLTDDLQVAGAYAQNTKANDFKRSWYAGVNYKGINVKKPGTWGVDAAYRYIAQNVSMAPTYDTYGMRSNKKGIDIGANYVPLYNTRIDLRYFWGKTLDTSEDDKTFFARASWFF